MRANKNIKNEYYIPQDVLNRIDPKETLLFNLRSKFISTFYKFYPIMAIIIIGMGLWLIIESILLFLISNLTATNTLKNPYNYSFC